METETTPENESDKTPTKPQEEVKPPQDTDFSARLAKILDQAESVRIRHMKHLSGRRFILTCTALLCVLAGGGAFGWFFLYEGHLAKGIFIALCALVPPVLLAPWVDTPRRKYRSDYKAKILPAIARALGNMRYHPQKGVNAGILNKTGIVPPHDLYKAEDCFIGRYKDTKIILSEARLYHAKEKDKPVFDGIFVLLEISSYPFDGHTIVTNDSALQGRLKKLLEIPTSPDTLFRIYTDRQQENHPALHEELIKELQETSLLFDKAPISASFFGHKYIFIAIPCSQDLFEPSNVFVPITTYQDALRCKKEIQKILSIIDVLELYKSS